MMAREKKPMRLKLDYRELDADDVLKMCTSKHSNSFTCSACGFSESKLVVQPFSLDFCYIKPNYHYCPNCGMDIASKDS